MKHPTKNLYCICGPSGSGKTTLANALEQHGFQRVVTTTSRQRREAESEGAYHFVSKEEFELMIEKGSFAEHALYAGSYYGSSFHDLNGGDFLVIEPQGVETLQKAYTMRPIKIIGLDAPLDWLGVRLEMRGDNAVRRLNEDIDIFKKLYDMADLFCYALSVEDTLKETMKFIEGLEGI